MLPFLIAVIIALLAILIWGYWRYRQPLRDYDRLSTEQTQEKSYGMLQQAMQKARELVGSAEMESLKLVSDSRYQTKKLESEYEKLFASSLSRLESRFSQQALQAEKEFIEYLQALKDQGNLSQNAVAQAAQQRTGEIFERFEQNLSTFLVQTQQQSTQAIELELRAARQLIDTYKAQQLSLIDENIIAMLEKTLALVLSKKITLKDNMDLIYEALEKAKVEKFIV